MTDSSCERREAKICEMAGHQGDRWTTVKRLTSAVRLMLRALLWGVMLGESVDK